MKRFKGHLVALVLVGGIGLAGCLPGFAPQSPPIAKTAPESPLIIAPCRAELTTFGDAGTNLLNRYDASLGYWATVGNPPDEVANTLTGFYSEASSMGAKFCGAGIITP